MQESPERLSGILQRIISRRGWNKRLKESTIISSWEKLFSPPLSMVAKPLKIEAGRLFLEVKEPAWKNEITYLKPQVLARINEFSGAPLIKDIFLV